MKPILDVLHVIRSGTEMSCTLRIGVFALFVLLNGWGCAQGEKQKGVKSHVIEEQILSFAVSEQQLNQYFHVQINTVDGEDILYAFNHAVEAIDRFNLTTGDVFCLR